MRTLPLSRGYEAIIDDCDYALLSSMKWCAFVPKPGKVYASRTGVGYLHRFILGAPKDLQVDHINGNGLDCRRENLRLATAGENACNKRKSKRSPWRFKGMSYFRGKWRVRIKLSGKQIFIGDFLSEEDAARAYDAAALELHGEFARLNFPAGAQI